MLYDMTQTIFRSIFILLVAALVAGGPITPITAQASEKDLQRQIDALREEIEELKVGGAETTGHGHGSGQTTFSGYGELHYNNDSKTSSTTGARNSQPKIDAHRIVIGVHHTFNDWISAHSEVDFEHAARDMELEFAYLDFRLTDTFGIRAGSLLMPVGYLNEYHEPPLFHSVERPTVQANIIPTTWQEGGAGIYGQLGGNTVNYRLYAVGTLNAANFNKTSGIRGGRQKVNNGSATNLAGVGRLEYLGIPGWSFGASGYSGNASQGDASVGDANVSLWEGDVKGRLGPWEFTTLYADTNLSDADKISTKISASNGPMANHLFGWYTEIAYHLLHHLQTEADLTAFSRYEKINTQASTPSGTADAAQDQQTIMVGLAYRPIPEVVVKVDNAAWWDANQKSWNIFNAGVGYMF